MNFKKLFVFFALLMVSQNFFCAVRIVLTAALAGNFFEQRKQQYEKSFSVLKKLGYTDFYVIEALRRTGPTFLEEHCNNVFYATVNNSHLRNNGINEALTLLEGCQYFDFHPDDIIVKLTGRYYLVNDFLIKTVENNQDADAIIKVNEDGNVFTLGFAMRYKYLKEMYENIDYASIDRTMIPIEYKVGDYVKFKKKYANFKVIYVDKLEIAGNLIGSTTANIRHDDVRSW